MGLNCLVSPVWQIWLFLLHMFGASLKGVPLPRSHPMAGGAGRIYAIAGTDATEKFMRQHGNPSMQVRLRCVQRCMCVDVRLCLGGVVAGDGTLMPASLKHFVMVSASPLRSCSGTCSRTT